MTHPNPNSELILYTSPDGSVKIDVVLEDETVWLTQEQMSKLFGKARTTIVEYIQNIYKERELDESSTCRKFRQVQKEGSRNVKWELITDVADFQRNLENLVGKKKVKQP